MGAQLLTATRLTFKKGNELRPSRRSPEASGWAAGLSGSITGGGNRTGCPAPVALTLAGPPFLIDDARFFGGIFFCFPVF